MSFVSITQLASELKKAKERIKELEHELEVAKADKSTLVEYVEFVGLTEKQTLCELIQT